MKLKLKPEAGQTVDIGHGEYARVFDRADQPFKVDEEEAALLLGTGVFEVVEQRPPAETVAHQKTSGKPGRRDAKE